MHGIKTHFCACRSQSKNPHQPYSTYLARVIQMNTKGRKRNSPLFWREAQICVVTVRHSKKMAWNFIERLPSRMFGILFEDTMPVSHPFLEGTFNSAILHTTVSASHTWKLPGIEPQLVMVSFHQVPGFEHFISFCGLQVVQYLCVCAGIFWKEVSC